MINDYPELIAEVTERSDSAGVPLRHAMLTGMAGNELNKKLNVSEMEIEATLTTDADGEVAVPSGLQSIRSIMYGKKILPKVNLRVIKGGGSGYAIVNGTIYTSLASSDLVATYYTAIPGLVANNTNWLLSANPEIYLYALLKQAFLVNLDIEKASAAGKYMDQLIDDFNMHDAVARFNGSTHRNLGTVI